MEAQDILFKTKAGVFSYRVAGILIRDGKVLLQHPVNDPGYAFPGGHVNFGEASADALVREFKEEIAADVAPLRLLWIGENFFPWGENDCHQVCLYFLAALCDETQIPLEGSFFAQDMLGGQRCDLEFCWMDLANLGDIALYPVHAKEKLVNFPDHAETIEHFVFRE